MKESDKHRIAIIALTVLLIIVIILFILTFLFKKGKGSGTTPTVTPAVTAGGNTNLTPGADPTTAPTGAAGEAKPSKPSISSYATEAEHIVYLEKPGDTASVSDIFSFPVGTVFTSSDPDVATVDKDGNIEAKSKGKTTVDATYTDEDGKKTSAKVKVEVGLSKVTPILGSTVLMFDKKEDYKVPFALIDEAGDDVTSLADIEWSSSDPGVVTVDKDGVVSPVADGETLVHISAAYRGQKFEFNIPAYVGFKKPVEDIDTGHNHVFKLVSNSATSCDTPGEIVYQCVCGAEEKETFDKLGHNYQLTETVAATCAAEGHLTYTCSRCGNSYQETLAKLAHNYKHETTAATCTTAGESHDKCTVCGDIKNSTTIAATGHNYVVTENVAATCDADGHKTSKCSKCGDTKTETIAKLGHNYKHEETAATCTTAGSSYDKCTTCGDIKNSTTTPATGHNYVVTENVAATCKAEGHKTSKCSKCGDTKTETIAKLEHNYKHETTAATCTTAGSSYDKCTVCGDIKNSTTTPATGHNYELTKTVEATCTKEGTKTYKCSKCGDTKTETIAKLAHNYQTVTVAATCTTDGSSCEKCTVCGATKNEVTIPATGHNLEHHVTAATCTTNGESYDECTRCGSKTNQTTLPKGHQYTYYADTDYAGWSQYVDLTDDDQLVYPGEHLCVCSGCNEVKKEACHFELGADGYYRCTKCNRVKIN